ncbi:MAG: ribonuclease P protein component [Flavobacteriia bacterium]|nr:ribonuclease P protein component [Flavobacteriia bacterium]MBH2023248.1 ribonuclease P protein component [Flavobacteriales bacterium]
MTDFRFPREEKLKHKREIDLLFAKGKWQTCGNLRIISIDLEKKPQEGFVIPNQKFGVSVSKRYFKKAVDRNRIKRLLREAYRLNKEIFTEVFGKNSISMIFWVSNEKPSSYQSLEESFITLCKSKK